MSLLNTTFLKELEDGAYTARISAYKEVEFPGKNPYIEVTLKLEDRDITDRWYASRLRYISHGLSYQLGYADETVTIGTLLEAASDHDITIIVNHDDKFGRQISYPTQAE